MYDIIIKNGTVIDGTGSHMRKSDIGIKEGKIQEVGDLQNEKADQVIDAMGSYVTPGFIDITNHSYTYWRIFSNAGLESMLFQGVTTIVGGNCGSSLAPLVDHDIIRSIQKWVDVESINLNWLNMKEFLEEVEDNKIGLNFGTLVGHSTLRRGIIRDEVRDLSSHEFREIKKLLRGALRDGALGFSTGLVYTHAKLADIDEIIELAKIVKKFDGVYATHIRDESGNLIDALKEAIEIARQSGVKLEISHLKAVGEKNWPRMREAISLIETARGNGIDVNFDVYPYTSTGSVLYILLPDWVSEGGKKMMLNRLRDPKTKARVIEEMKTNDVDYSKVIISISPLNKTLSRRGITDIAASQDKSVEEAIIDILVASDGRVVTTMEVLSEKNMQKAIQHPFSIISSNGSGYDLEYKKSGDLVHPRNFGAFTRVLEKYVKNDRVLGWEEAIHKITGKPAEKYGIKMRGTIEKGNFADLAIFDPNTIKDLSTFENPYQYAKGMSHVIINGEAIIEEGKYNGKKAGQVVRR